MKAQILKGFICPSANLERYQQDEGALWRQTVRDVGVILQNTNLLFSPFVDWKGDQPCSCTETFSIFHLCLQILVSLLLYANIT